MSFYVNGNNIVIGGNNTDENENTSYIKLNGNVCIGNSIISNNIDGKSCSFISILDSNGNSICLNPNNNNGNTITISSITNNNLSNKNILKNTKTDKDKMTSVSQLIENLKLISEYDTARFTLDIIKEKPNLFTSKNCSIDDWVALLKNIYLYDRSRFLKNVITELKTTLEFSSSDWTKLLDVLYLYDRANFIKTIIEIIPEDKMHIGYEHLPLVYEYDRDVVIKVFFNRGIVQQQEGKTIRKPQVQQQKQQKQQNQVNIIRGPKGIQGLKGPIGSKMNSSSSSSEMEQALNESTRLELERLKLQLEEERKKLKEKEVQDKEKSVFIVGDEMNNGIKLKSGLILFNHSKVKDQKNTSGDQQNSCVICLENRRIVTSMPCSHLTMCIACSDTIKKCTICASESKFLLVIT